MIQLTNVQITIDDQELTGFVSLNLTHDIYNIDTFEISFRLETLEDLSEFIIERSKSFLGKTCAIRTEFTTVGDSETLEGFSYRGIVTSVNSSKSGLRSYDIITIKGQSPAVLLQGKPTCRTFLDKSLEDIVNEVLQPYPRNLLNPTVSPLHEGNLSYVVQYMESDYDFLARLARRYGQWFFYSGEELFFIDLPESEDLDLRIGNDLQSFQFGLNLNPTKQQLRYVDKSTATVFGWESGNDNAENQQNEYGRHAYDQSNNLFTEQANRTFNSLNVPPDEFEGQLNKAGNLGEIRDVLDMTSISGNSTNPSVKLGQEVTISNRETENDSEQSFGRYRLTSIVHSCDQSLNYNNAFMAMPAESQRPENTNADDVIRSKPLRGQVCDNADPDMIGRVKVDFGWVAGEPDQTPWIPVSTPYTMHKGGFFFIPEVGSEVLVAFEDGNIERPYVAGAYNTAADEAGPADEWGDATPDIKAIRTISGHTIEFHDTSGEEKIRIYDNQANEIILDTANGEIKIIATDILKIEAREIDIRADNGISMNAGSGDLACESSGDVNINGTNVGISANAGLTAEGNSSAELTSSASVTVRGSIVQIN